MLEYAFLTFGSLLAIVDPFAAIPTFLALTANDNTAHRRRTARTACTVCGAVMAAFAILGPTLFKLFGITLPAFQVAGGLVLMLSAFDMIRANAERFSFAKIPFLFGMVRYRHRDIFLFCDKYFKGVVSGRIKS